jgi:hypothetical protein
MEAKGPVWDRNMNSPYADTQRVTNNYNFAYSFDYDTGEKSGVPIPNTSWDYGFQHRLSGTSDSLIYSYGKYKVSLGFDYNTALIYFYLDWTDCDYSDHYSHNDTWFRFNNSDTTLDISWDDSNFNDPTIVEQGEHPTFEIWDYKGKDQGYSGQNTDDFELYLTVSTQNDHPYLNWNAYDGRSGNNALDYYEVWKKGSGSYSLKDTTSNTYYEDTSEDATAPGVKTYVYYKIRAVELDDDESLFGNEVRTAVYNPKQETKSDQFSEESINGKPSVYALKQNCPNPFNPTTTISFDLPEGSIVQLQIFDVQGKLISTLVNERIDEGNHLVSFNSEGLPSGVYFYRLSAKNFTDIKRMLLLK